ncbi:integral membrane sensor signal transduction histidine kinase [Methylocella silvestris BL2]|uniref:histidine kinase n=1 Tax=Methylocella silvestris (strain DSM 15510 / CIP 108128 / LMG 27833 / NCIMB 13906 / BL2) TaxID=395965 RepID=B8EQN0_METSB|nr:ActS/PrrB/RegB family redox-sensitive histidine kinase [Methylocella silvestris]ACK49301.1 integral membrane sensor signal transduction histidine kinase [Methylocella silvestris BL2]
MSSLLNIDFRRRTRRLHVDTLVRLRWLALCGQAAAVLFTELVLEFPLPLVPCLLIIAISAVLNVALRVRYGRVDLLNEKPAAVILAYDILQLTALLYLTGGIENPFSMLFLAPIMVSAVSLSGWTTFALTLLTIGAASVLTFHHYPFPWYRGETLTLPFIFSAGAWTAHVVSAIFIAIYASQVALESSKLADALSATELVLAREQHLTQLDGLAAAAAHELGTPLATITLVAKDLERQLPQDGPIREDVALLAQEVARCRTILGKLASLGNDDGNVLDEMTVTVMIEEVVAPQRDFGVKIAITQAGSGRKPVMRRNPAILYGLGNLIENAIDFASNEVRIDASWDLSRVKLVIEDDGPGFSPEVLSRAGAPYVTTKTDRRLKSDDGSGLGLGLFIAKTLLERSGATVLTGNVPAPATGARIIVEWKRAAFERGVKIPAPAKVAS